ncbi:mechanosensitive ion channel family protein [Candidatus Palauibacter sp.]|uniref:mechanosensitive ion channel family protein n=1 Tax=Candidatus Palauibacter sp. TaxID=3101350 RepID=UPI003B012EB7
MDMDWDAILLEPIRAFFGQLVGFLPNLLAVLAILIGGWIVAKLIKMALVRLLGAVKADSLAERVQLAEMLAKGGIERTFSQLVGALAYWIVMLVVLVAALNALQLTATAELLQRLVGFLPTIVTAVVVLIVGILAAGFLGATIRAVASNAGIAQAQVLGQFAQVIVIIFAVVVALQQVQVQFVGDAFLIILGAISFGLALAFGLGCKDLAGRWVSDLVDRLSPRKK